MKAKGLRCLIILLSVLLPSICIQCGAGSLSREKAAALIGDNETIKQGIAQHFWDDKWGCVGGDDTSFLDALISLGLVDSVKEKSPDFTPCLGGATFMRLTLNAKGKAESKNWKFERAQPVSGSDELADRYVVPIYKYEFKITGMKSSDRFVSAEFTWALVPVPPFDERVKIQPRKGDGIATFVLYDDGWRLAKNGIRLRW